VNGIAPRNAPPEANIGPQANVTPEEQAEYDQFVNNALLVIYDKTTFPKVLQSLASAPNDPATALAQTAVMVVRRLRDSASQKSVELNPDVMFHGGVEVIEDLANVSDKAGIHTFTAKELEGATYAAMDLYRAQDQADGNIDQEKFKQDLAQLKEADDQGRLGELLPGLEGNNG